MKKQILLLLIVLINVQFGLFAQNNYSPEYLVPYRKGDLWGYSDTLKKIIIEPKFEEAGFFYKGKRHFFADGLKDGQNVRILPDGSFIKKDARIEEYLEIGEVEYEQEINPALSINGKHGFRIDGFDIEFPSVYSEMIEVIDDYSNFPICAIFKLASNDMLGMVDTLGNILIPFEYSSLELYNSEEKTFMAYKNGSYGLIDWKNNVLYPFELSLIKQLSWDIFPSRNQSMFYGVLDQKGKVLLPFKYDSIADGYYSGGNKTYLKASSKGKDFFVNLKGVEYYEE